jgi:exopolysaccharide biosynthesis predicted pyruvyltransferase EpsI
MGGLQMEMKKLLFRVQNRANLILSDMLFVLNLLIVTKKNSSEKLFLVATPEYHNIGDIAIMAGANKFFSQYFNQYSLHEITLEVFSRNKKLIKFIISNNDTIFITGGGFLGNLWTDSNNLVMHILGHYKSNSVVILPQTMFYTNDSKKIDFDKDKVLYEKHEKCLLLVREKVSLKFVNNNIKFSGNSRCILAPDMALCLTGSNIVKKREGVMLCLRNDKERKMTDSEYKIIINSIKEAGFTNYFNTDTAYNKSVKRKNRKLLLDNKKNEFLKSELIITDRLHGMIIAAITNTPCVAIVSCSPKILGVYKWIERFDYIRVIESYDDFLNVIVSTKLLSHNSYNEDSLEGDFSKMAIEINTLLNRG